MCFFADHRDFPSQQISLVWRQQKSLSSLACPSSAQGGSFVWENVNDSSYKEYWCWKKQLPYRSWLALTGEVLESWVATLHLHHPRQSLKMLFIDYYPRKGWSFSTPSTTHCLIANLLCGKIPLLTPDLEISSILCVSIITVFWQQFLGHPL